MDIIYLKRRRKNPFARFKLAVRCRAVLDVISRFRGPAAPRILDIGSCDGKMLVYLRGRLPGAELVGIEPEPKFLESPCEPGLVRAGSAEALPFPDGYFDFAVMSSVIEHIEDPAKGLAEALRALKPGGVLIVISVVPFYERLLVHLRIKKSDHYRNFSLSEAVGIIKATGFQVLESRPMPFPLFYNLTVARR